MEIMGKIAYCVREKSWMYYVMLFFSLLFTVTLLAAGNLEIFKADADMDLAALCKDHLAFSLSIISFSLIIVIWFYYADYVYQRLDTLGELFPHHQGYAELAGHANSWFYQFDLSRPGGSRKFKLIYQMTWIAFSSFSLFFTWSCFDNRGFQPLVIIPFEFLNVFLLVLNFSSYYICIVFVYFLMRLYKLEREDRLDYVQECPSLSHGFFALRHFSEVIYRYFLFDSLLCTVAYLLFLFFSLDPLSFGDDPVFKVSFFCTTIPLFLFGLTTWVGIVLLSRAYLNRVHESWKLRSSQWLQEQYARAADDAARNAVTLKQERVLQDTVPTSIWEILFSAVTLLANFATIGALVATLLLSS